MPSAAGDMCVSVRRGSRRVAPVGAKKGGNSRGLLAYLPRYSEHFLRGYIKLFIALMYARISGNAFAGRAQMRAGM